MFQKTGFSKCGSLNENGSCIRMLGPQLVDLFGLYCQVSKSASHSLSTLWLNSKLLMEHHACLPVAKLPTMMPIGL